MKRHEGLRDRTRRRVLGLTARLAVLGWLLPWLPARGWGSRLSRHEAAFYHHADGGEERT